MVPTLAVFALGLAILVGTGQAQGYYPAIRPFPVAPAFPPPPANGLVPPTRSSSSDVSGTSLPGAEPTSTSTSTITLTHTFTATKGGVYVSTLTSTKTLTVSRTATATRSPNLPGPGTGTGTGIVTVPTLTSPPLGTGTGSSLPTRAANGTWTWASKPCTGGLASTPIVYTTVVTSWSTFDAKSCAVETATDGGSGARPTRSHSQGGPEPPYSFPWGNRTSAYFPTGTGTGTGTGAGSRPWNTSVSAPYTAPARTPVANITSTTVSYLPTSTSASSDNSPVTGRLPSSAPSATPLSSSSSSSSSVSISISTSSPPTPTRTPSPTSGSGPAPLHPVVAVPGYGGYAVVRPEPVQQRPKKPSGPGQGWKPVHRRGD